jgi:hypothetical protein
MRYLLLFLGFFLLIAACKKDSDKDRSNFPKGNCMVDTVKSNGSPQVFYYDSFNRIVKAITFGGGNNVITSVKYSGNIVVLSYNFMTDSIIFYLNEVGLCDSVITNSDSFLTKETYQYNSSFQLLKSQIKGKVSNQVIDEAFDYVWENGDLIKKIRWVNGKKFETTYTYNNAYINCLAAFEKGTSFLPVSAHLLTKTKRSNGDEINFSYEFNSNNWVVKVTEAYNNGNSVTNYSWKCK